MDGTTIGFVAVVGAFAYAFYEQHTKTKIKLASSQNHPNQDALKQEIDSLKQRVATLEAIVTDKSYSLKQEIERL